MFKSRKPSKINQIPPGINAQVLSFWVVLPKNPRACLVFMDIFKKPFFSQKCLYLNPLHSEEFEFISSSHPKSKRTSPRHPHNIVAQLRNQLSHFPLKEFWEPEFTTETEKNPVGSWAQKPICPAFLTSKTPATLTFPELQSAYSNSCWSREEQPGNRQRQD